LDKERTSAAPKPDRDRAVAWWDQPATGSDPHPIAACCLYPLAQEAKKEESELPRVADTRAQSVITFRFTTQALFCFPFRYGERNVFDRGTCGRDMLLRCTLGLLHVQRRAAWTTALLLPQIQQIVAKQCPGSVLKKLANTKLIEIHLIENMNIEIPHR
jgi:hypothetical protein